MQIETRKTSEIRPYAKNPRKNDAAVQAVAQSIRAFGFRQPIVVDEHDEIVVGDTRYKAALQLGLEEVPVHVIRGLSPAQIAAYRIADNKTGEIAEWDDDRLIRELIALQEAEFPLDVTGFSESELRRLLDTPPNAGQVDPDEIPEAPDEAVTQLGQLWTLGNHRLLCGDSSKTEDVDRLLNGSMVQLVNSDPPYNVSVEPRSRTAIAAGLSTFTATPTPDSGDTDASTTRGPAKRKLRAKDRPIENDCLSQEEFSEKLRAWFGNFARALEPGRAFYIWGGYLNLGAFPPALKDAGLYFSQGIVWDKQHPVLSRKDFMGCFELAFYGWREGAAHQFFGPNNALDLWAVKKLSPQAMVHLTEKPVELAERAMIYSSRSGEKVLDLFGGSGSTLIAAEKVGRRAFLMEMDPLYCDTIVARWERFTGKKAVLAS
ncbi:MAG: ParB N-terminal domain-containing protein [Gemmataceae bacterium]|nr:ParB N-terminal domain-containing protein [Gemmataceae bacterium]